MSAFFIGLGTALIVAGFLVLIFILGLTENENRARGSAILTMIGGAAIIIGAVVGRLVA